MPQKHISVWPTEIRGGVVTFITMAYILVVNPTILSATGMPKGDVFFATCVSSAVATILMALVARYPFALAPGMGLNAFFAYTVCIGNHIPWQTALAAVLISGLLFVVLSVSGFRKQFLESVPKDLGIAIAAGIGLFIAFIGLQQAGLVVKNDATMVSLGSFRSEHTLISLAGLAVTIALVSAQVRGAILIGMTVATVLAALLGQIDAPTRIAAFPPLPEQTIGTALLSLKELFSLQMLPIIFTMLFIDMFDTMGTLLALGHTSGHIQTDGTLPRANHAFMSDAIGTIIGALLGTSTVTTYIESSAGITDGAQSGRASLVTGGLFLLALFLFPIFSIVPAAATAPALIVVGALMFSQAAKIQWKEPPVAISAALTILSMPLTYSISTGIGIGFIAFT
ncbi:MAG: NCS2 family permease, partial [Deltaproteobacteria bacterium]|nr:NCS2 family permease [Deltaproteobacteria bacterium]MBN2673561.1 NCS2 family permease [Deltaproteobacteria bacterium]